MCAVLSQFGHHTQAIENANKAVVLSEDNILKTYHLYSLIELKKNEDKSKPVKQENQKELKDANNQDDNIDENSESYIEKMIQDEKVAECELIMKSLSLVINKNRELHKNQESSQENNQCSISSIKKICNKDKYSL